MLRSLLWLAFQLFLTFMLFCGVLLLLVFCCCWHPFWCFHLFGVSAVPAIVDIPSVLGVSNIFGVPAVVGVLAMATKPAIFCNIHPAVWYSALKKIPQRMLSSWILHQRHIHQGNTSTVNDKMYCLCDMCVRILSNSSIRKIKAEMVVTTCFGMPTNKIKHTMHYSGFKRDPGSNPVWERNFFCLDIKKFLYTCERDKYNDVKKHHFEKKCINRKNPPSTGKSVLYLAPRDTITRGAYTFSAALAHFDAILTGQVSNISLRPNIFVDFLLQRWLVLKNHKSLRWQEDQCRNEESFYSVCKEVEGGLC